MKHRSTFFLLFLIVQLSFSQSLKKQTLSSQGSSLFVYTATKSYFVQQSIGQGSVIQTFNSPNYSLRQGFLQPISPSALIDASDTSIDAVIFPNPFVDVINIHFGEPVVGPVTAAIFDMVGRQVYAQTFTPNPRLLLEIDALAVGPYFLRLNMRTKTLTAKLIKK